MNSSISHLPKDLSVAHQMIVELLEALREKEHDNERLRHQLEQLRRRLYGKKSEKITDEQFLFLYAGLLGESPPSQEEPSETREAVAELPSEPRERKVKKRRRRVANLRVKRIEYPLDERECVCEKCGGTLQKFGEEITRQLDYEPASFYIREHVRLKYACPACQEKVVVSAMPSQPIEKGLPGPGLLAQVLTNKYVNHLPLYRQEQMFAREGVDLSRKTTCGWVRGCAALFLPMYERMRKDVLSSKVLHTDDTPILVQGKRKSATPRHQGRLWVYVGDEEHAQVMFDFTPNRSRDGPEAFLKGYRGYLQADAFVGYDSLYEKGEVIEVGCWAHARRHFFDVQTSDAARSLEAIAYIQRLYGIEREAKEEEEKNQLAGEARAEYRRAMREERSRPILDEFHAWLRAQECQVLPKSPMGEAIGYTWAQWEALNRYVEDGDLSIDNNAAEQQIRPIAVGRRNWLFAGSDEGGRRAAIIYSLIATCKRHEINPFTYLRDILERIADHPINRIHELTPIAWKQAHERSESTPEAATT